jgi:hypothetical protein
VEAGYLVVSDKRVVYPRGTLEYRKAAIRKVDEEYVVLMEMELN